MNINIRIIKRAERDRQQEEKLRATSTDLREEAASVDPVSIITGWIADWRQTRESELLEAQVLRRSITNTA